MVFDKGYIGQGSYNSKRNGQHTVEYLKWHRMFYRCYSKAYLKDKPTYRGCSVSNEWYNFQEFAKWFNENKWSKDCIVLDKDILCKQNKIYSPDTCILVDQRINSLLLKHQNDRGEYPIGVIYKPLNNKYQARCNMMDKRQSLGLYNTPEEAFRAYKKFKELYIKQVADEYKSKYPNFPERLYNAMYSYQVEITD